MHFSSGVDSYRLYFAPNLYQPPENLTPGGIPKPPQV